MNAPLQAPILTPEELSQINRVQGMVVQGRTCGSCTLCCKVLDIPAVEKPAGKWCPHCQPGKGCGIYAARPAACHGFYCEWMISKGLGPEWKPERARFLLAKSDDGRLTAHVDPGYPAAWRASPYYENFKIWAAEAARKDPMHQIGIMIGQRLTLVLPDRDIEFGVVAADEMIKVTRNGAGAVSAEKMRRADYERQQAALQV